MSVVTTRRGLRRFIGFIVASLVALTPAFGQPSAAPFGQIGTWTNPNGGLFEFSGLSDGRIGHLIK